MEQDRRSSGPNEEARLMVRMRQAHSMALKRSADKLTSHVLLKRVRPIQGKLGDADPAALAAQVVAQVIEKSEESFEKLCQRIRVNEKFLALERAREEHLELQQRRADQLRRQQNNNLSDLIGETTPLPGGRDPTELVRESTMNLKRAERARLLVLAEEAERSADAEAAKVAAVAAELEEWLGRVAGTQQALAEACSSLR
ncbi:unnamed protein product [Ectocarpus sp. CCAP 1310/34]|nr:unnamed protein product [Ectocarpus sp. CCAP 1310/34]